MIIWWTWFLFVLFFFNTFLLFKSYGECQKHNAFGLTHGLGWLGMFVWGDVLVLSIFWMIMSLACILLNSWILFALIGSVFWLVRSLGETIYWFLQQFATVKRDPPESLTGYNLVKNESIWFVYQVMWQCICVVSIIATVYFSHLWIQQLSA